MKQILVLGSGCAKCLKTAQLIASVAGQRGAPVSVEKVTDAQSLLAYGVMRTPAVVIDGRLVHSGSVPKADDVVGWLREG